MLLAATALTAFGGAQSAAQTVQTWTGNANNVLDNAANWTPGPVPGGVDTAQFDGITGNSSAVRDLVQGADASVRQIDVVSGAGSYSLDTSGNRLDIGQATPGGISVASGSTFTIANTGGGVVAFDNASVLTGNVTINNTGGGSGVDFLNGSNAGSATLTLGAGTNATFNQTSSAGSASITANNNSLLFFFNDSVAGNATIVSNGFSLVQFNGNTNAQNANITINGGAGSIRFWESASAGNANITVNNGLVSFGQTGSADTATAANATINVLGGAVTFEGNTTAGNATIFISSAGGVGFGDTATGGDARFILASDGFGGLLDFSASAGAGGVVTAGSIEGGGEIRIGGLHNLFRVGSNNLSTEFSGVICECFGPGALEKVGTGTLVLSGDNTYGGTTTISQGVLQIGNGGSTGSVAGDILNDSVLAINRSDNFNLANDISGVGAFFQIGTGTTTLTGVNAYTGATNVMSGTLQAGAVNVFGNGSAVTVNQGATLSLNNFNQTVGSLAGGGSVTLGNAVLTVGNGTDTIFSGVISGSGSVVKQGTGTLALTGANTHTGITTIAGGVLQIGNGGSTGSLAGNILNNSVLAINRSDSFVFANEISGTGALNHIGIGTTALTGTNTYTGTTTISQGVLQIGNGGSTGSVAGDILNNSVLAINRSDNFTLANDISGIGAFFQIGTGTTTLTGANTYTGATIVMSGTLQAGAVNVFGNGSAVTVDQGATLSLNNFNQTVGSLAGGGSVTLGNAVLTVGNGTDTIFSGVISGSGSVVKQGTGMLALTGNNTFGGGLTINDGLVLVTGANTYAGGTTINAGTLQLGNGGSTGSVLGDIFNSGVLAFNRSDNFTLANAISGAGTVQFNGPGIVTIADTQAYTGVTIVNGGGLIVNGSIGASQQLVLADNTFVGGIGVLPNVTVNGTLSPGNSIGTITVQGDLTMGAGGSYAVEFNGVTSDSTVVTGTAALAGQVLPLPTSSGAFVPRNYTILTAAGGITGTFDGIDRSVFPAAFAVSLSYTGTEVVMSLSSALSQLSGLNRNQRAVAGSLDVGLNAGGAIGPGFVTLLNLPGAALPGALTQLSGEVATGAQTAGFQLMNQYLALLLNPMAEGRGSAGFGPVGGIASAEALPRDIAQAYAAAMPVKAAPSAAAPSGWSVWGAGFGGTNRTAGEGVVIGSHDIRPSVYGFAAGADYRLAAGTLLGFSLAGGGTSWSLAGGLGSGRSDAFQTGGYASHRIGAAYVSAALAYAWHDGSIDRTVFVAGTDTLRGDFRADSIGARLEGGYRFAMGRSGVTPYGALQGQSFRTAGFGERAAGGSAQFALNYASRTSQALRTELGAWADSHLALASGHALALRGRLAWAHDDVTGARIGATFQALPISTFTVLGAAAPSDLALVTAGAELRLRNGLSIGARFEGEFSGAAQTYGGTGTIRYVW